MWHIYIILYIILYTIILCTTRLILFYVRILIKVDNEKSKFYTDNLFKFNTYIKCNIKPPRRYKMSQVKI